MKLRSWQLLGAWLTAGAVGLVLLYPDRLPRGLVACWPGEQSGAGRDAPRPVDEASGKATLPEKDATVDTDSHRMVVLPEASPSDYNYRAAHRDSSGSTSTDPEAAAGTVGEAETAPPPGEAADNAIGVPLGQGFIGSGQGGGGVGNASGGIGRIGEVSRARLPTSPSESTPAATAAPESRPDEPAMAMAAPSLDEEPTKSEFDSMLDQIDRKLASLPEGSIAFNTPEVVPLGKSATIELLVSLTEDESELAGAVRGPGPVESASVNVSPYLEATLTGVGVQIAAATPDRQLLSRNQRTAWRWQIEPTHADQLELHLTLTAILPVDGQDQTRAIRTFERTIIVDVPITHRVATFVGNNAEWLGSALIIPLLGALYQQFRKRRQPAAAPADETDRRAA